MIVTSRGFAMPSPLAGIVCLLLFALSQAVRDAFFGSVFQSVSYFRIAVLAFGGSTLLFGGWASLRRPAEVALLLRHGARFAWLNLTTAAAWLMYFHALHHLEPAVVTTLYTGAGPLSVVALAAWGAAPAEHAALAMGERTALAGVGASLLGVAGVALAGHSGMEGAAPIVRAGAVGAAALGGATIAISHLTARRFADLGVGSAALLGLRFPVTLLIALAAEAAVRGVPTPAEAATLPPLAGAAFLLIVLPSYFLQLGISRVTPLTVNVMRALGPVFVFAVQQFDGRIQFSGGTLAAVTAFIACAAWAALARAWREAEALRR